MDDRTSTTPAAARSRRSFAAALSLGLAAVLCVARTAGVACAQTAGGSEARLSELEKRLEARIAALESEVAALRAALATRPQAAAPPVAPMPGAASPAPPAVTASPVAPTEAPAPGSPPASSPSGAPPAPPEKSPDQLALEQQLARELGPPEGAAPPPDAPPPAQPWTPSQPITLAGGGKNYLNLSLDGLFAAGASTAQDVSLVETGGHDPAERGFTIQNVELVLEGAVDPYFRGQANVVMQLTPEGETTVELEEAYVTTTSLPHNLQVKAGTYFSEFGRLNPQHPHSWDFVDQPLVNGRFLGPDGLRNPGARVSWLMPTPFYSELFLSIQDSQGETAASFRGYPGEVIHGRPIQERPVRTLGDMLYVPRWTGSFDLTDNQTLVVGASGAFGPNGSGQDTSTQIYGIDLFWKWKAPNAQAGFPFVKWQTEAMARRYEAGAWTPDAGAPLPAETLRDRGAYTQVSWGFRRGWVAGLRGDYLSGSDGADGSDPSEQARWRISPNLTWFPTEYSKLRLQWNHDELELTGSEESIWLQFEFLLGAHAAHKF